MNEKRPSTLDEVVPFGRSDMLLGNSLLSEALKTPYELQEKVSIRDRFRFTTVNRAAPVDEPLELEADVGGARLGVDDVDVHGAAPKIRLSTS